ncbi:MAG: TIGR04222 domain-containing membrane protein [Pseudomonadota bacterium]
MDKQQSELYARIQAFFFDNLNAQLPFSHRLAQENNWSQAYANAVIEEYKKFVFLAIVANHPVTPSDQIDQAWHLHLTYTDSYWNDFCPNILGKPLHHGPTQGGVEEYQKFKKLYQCTLNSYHHFFGIEPPKDIWPEMHRRFNKKNHYMRLNKKNHWVIKKPDWNLLIPSINQKFIFVCTIFVVLSSGWSFAAIPNPFEFKGSEFLVFYFFFAIVGLGLAYVLKSRFFNTKIFSNVNYFSILDVYELAFLVAGKKRLIYTGLLNLFLKGYLEIQFSSNVWKVKKNISDIQHPVEKAIAQNIINSQGHIPTTFAQPISFELINIQSSLQQHGLLLKDFFSKENFFPLFILMLVLCIGFIKVIKGIMHHKPVFYLIVMMMSLVIITIIMFKPRKNDNSYKMSPYGKHVLYTLKKNAGHLKIKPSSSQLPLAFALFGAPVIANIDMMDQLYLIFITHQPSAASKAGYSGSGCSGGDGGGGGDGCGGCGGCS